MFTEEQGQDAHVDRWKRMPAMILMQMEASRPSFKGKHLFDNFIKDMTSLWSSVELNCKVQRQLLAWEEEICLMPLINVWT